MQRFQVSIGLGLASFVLFLMAFFVFLPMVIFVPGKFALSFTIGSLLLIACLAIMRGPRKTLTGLVSREKVIFSGSYILSLGETGQPRPTGALPARAACGRAPPL